MVSRKRILELALIAVALLSVAGAQTETTGLPQADQRWLNEDVAYIISAPERTQFLAIHDDHERDAFVRDFWEKRNPSPGSAHNSYKEEHYRRIAFANANFASTVPGWQTDRGKTYIVLGAPEKITASKAGSSATQTWHYRANPLFVNGRDVRFVDRCNCGEFQVER